jgi:hypothetical protein
VLYTNRLVSGQVFTADATDDHGSLRQSAQRDLPGHAPRDDLPGEAVFHLSFIFGGKMGALSPENSHLLDDTV